MQPSCKKIQKMFDVQLIPAPDLHVSVDYSIFDTFSLINQHLANTSLIRINDEEEKWTSKNEIDNLLATFTKIMRIECVIVERFLCNAWGFDRLSQYWRIGRTNYTCTCILFFFSFTIIEIRNCGTFLYGNQLSIITFF